MKARNDDAAEPDALTPSQRLALEALAGGASMAAAAEAAGVDRETVYEWRDSVALFVVELNRARAEQREATRAELRALATEAASTLRDLLTSKETPAPVRLRAALAALDRAERDPIGPTELADVVSEFKDREMSRFLGAMGGM
jgi:transposase-like protein